jgi:Flp pilus assembly protein TadD
MALVRLLALVCGLCLMAGGVTAQLAAPGLAQARQMAAAGQLQPALDATERALRDKPRDAELRFFRAVLLMDLGRTELAFTAFSELHDSYPELPDPLNNLAVIHASRGQWHEARQRLEEALRNDPQHRSARENLGDVYLRLAIEQWQAAAGARADGALQRKLTLARSIATPQP